MFKEQFKVAIKKSKLFVKEIAAKSGVKKRTIDKWVGGTEPKVNDFYKVCKILSVTMEQIVDGKAGEDYVRKIVRNNPNDIQVPDRIYSLVKDILLLDDKELKGIRANVEALTEDKKKRATDMDNNASLKANST
jgi:transcriptional regulator with XRE-family HTH domain